MHRKERFFSFPVRLCVLREDNIILQAVIFLFSEGITCHRQKCILA